MDALRMQILRVLDKWHRLGREEVLRQLAQLGLSPEQAAFLTHGFPVSEHDAQKS